MAVGQREAPVGAEVRDGQARRDGRADHWAGRPMLKNVQVVVQC